ncbi:MAG: 4Fe-4S dicluster domain-containing protein [Opitutaceae bacterium]|jgi:NADH-quinone oxidoreductase subunit I|nr:4Fe-4S dicluster domain-containing protein [Opitutaceae bacterium]
MLGSGILKGLLVTARNFVGSFHDRERLPTVQYPEERAPVGEAFRTFPFLVSDCPADADASARLAGLRGVACQICERNCPPRCIHIEKSKDKKPDAAGKPQLYPAVFEIDISVCMGCQICVEVCPFDSIKMDKVFEIAVPRRSPELLLDRDRLSKPNAYYRRIRPSEAAAVDAARAAEQAAAKARADAAAKAAAARQAAAATPPAA